MLLRRSACYKTGNGPWTENGNCMTILSNTYYKLFRLASKIVAWDKRQQHLRKTHWNEFYLCKQHYINVAFIFRLPLKLNNFCRWYKCDYSSCAYSSFGYHVYNLILNAQKEENILYSNSVFQTHAQIKYQYYMCHGYSTQMRII